MKKNFYAYSYALFFVSFFCNNIIAMETTPPLKVPTEEENPEEYSTHREKPVTHKNNCPSLGSFILNKKNFPPASNPPSNNPAPNNEPRRPRRNERPLSLEELEELGIRPETLEDEEWIDALKLHLPSSSSGLSSSEQKAREEAMIRMYGMVAEVRQQKNLSKELNLLKVHNEVQQARLLLASNFPELHGQVLAQTKLAQDNFKLKYALQHPASFLSSLGIQGIETGIVQGTGHVIAKIFIAGADKVGNLLYSQYTTTGRKLSMDERSQKIMEEIALLAGDKQMIDQLKKQGFQSAKTKFYDQQIPLIANNKLDEWTDNRLSRWGLRYEPQETIKLPSTPIDLSVDPMIEDEEPILMDMDIDTINTNNHAVPN